MSNRGRPPKSGDRWPNGRLKHTPQKDEGNPIAKQQAMLGGSASGKHPLDFAFGLNLLTTRQVKMGHAYARMYAETGMQGPRLAQGGPTETETSVIDQPFLGKSWIHSLGRKGLVQVFDAAFNTPPETISREDRERLATQRWQVINHQLSAMERQELFAVCIQADWRLWIPTLATKRNLDPTITDVQALGAMRAAQRAALLSGLNKVGRLLAKPKPEQPSEPPKQPYTGPKIDLVTEHVDDETGELLLTTVRRVRV